MTAALALLGTIAVGVPDARADAPAADADAGAQAALNRRGLERFEAHDYAQAIAVWERLVSESGEVRAFKALYNLGLAYEAAGDATHAVERFDAFVKRVAEQPGAIEPDLEERRQDAVERTRALKASHGALRLVVRPSRSPDIVRIDGSTARLAPFTAYVAPGPHTVVLGESPRARRVVVETAAATPTDVDATAPEAPPAPASARAPTEAGFPVALVAIGAAAALASFALPIAFYVRAQSKGDDAAALGAGHTQYAAAIDDYDSARTAYYVSYAAPALIGAVTLGIALANIGRIRSSHASVTVGPASITARGAF